MGDKVQWYRNGLELPNESNKELIISEGGEYYAKLFDPCSGLHIETNRLEVNKIAEPVLRFNYPDGVNFCNGSQGALTTDNNELYQYRWYRNGTLIDGMVSATLANISVAGRYRVEASACNGAWVSTKEVQVNFIEIPKPVLSLDRSGYCDGGEATITAAIIFDEKSVTGWTPYQFYWFKNGAAMGVSGSSIKVKEAGRYKVQAFGCSGVVTSDEIVLSFTKMEPPVITADKPAYCIGDNATIAFDLPKAGTYTIAWYRDGQIISDAPSKTSFTTHTAGSYFASIINDQTGCQVVSTEKAISFEAPPSISITKVVKTTLCDGEPVDLTASFSAGAVRWSTGETAAAIIVKQSGTYQATVTTVAGCSVQLSETVQLYPKPELNLPQATLCQYTKSQVTLTAPGGFVNYEWNGQPGSETYTTDRLGNVSLTVTDHNGCKATQTIAISSRCDDIHIPNTFMPNNYGYNDRWIISGLDGNADATVHVFDRWGNQVFQSKGYAKPWDGTINGKPLTGGTYYYVISAHAGSQIFSGSVTLIL